MKEKWLKTFYQRLLKIFYMELGNIYTASGKAIIYRSKIRISPDATVEGGLRALVGLDQSEVVAQEDLVLALLAKVNTMGPDLARVILRRKLQGG